MRFVCIVLLFSTIIACDDVDPLHLAPQCGEDCAITTTGEVVFGDDAAMLTCNVGTAVCEKIDGAVDIRCEDFVPYSFEKCDADNVDEDCDGKSNDIIISYTSRANTCEGVGECQRQDQKCMPDGTLACVPISNRFGPEICDGFDNDCDGLVDEDDPDLTYDRFVYDGPASTINVGNCRAGVFKCIEGKEVIFGQILPEEEICGNHEDDDCDGIVDEDEDDRQPDAFLLSIDISGSMIDVIYDVTTALCGWAESPIFNNSSFAIQAVGDEFGESPFITKVTDFVPADEACDAMIDYMLGGQGGGLEYVPLAIFLANDVRDERYTPWPAGLRRKVVFFSDEPPQGVWGYTSNDIRLAVNSCTENNYEISGFVLSDYSTWSTMTTPCGGWLESIDVPSRELQNTLESRFAGNCEGN